VKIVKGFLQTDHILCLFQYKRCYFNIYIRRWITWKCK